MHPAQRPHFQSIQSQYLYAPEPRRFSQVSGHSDQTSASQSPPSSSVAHGHPSSSLDAYLQPKSGSSPLLSPDSLSIASGRSVGTLGSGASGHSGSNPNNSSHNGRFMAVTRQEEMLLAALRKKRARMRENIIAELEAEQEEEDTSLEDDVPSRLLQPPHRHHGRHHHHQNHQPLSPPPSQPLPAPPPPMKHQRQQQQQQPQGSSSARQGSRRASSQVAARLAPLHELPLRRGGLGQAVESSSYLHSSPTSPLPEPPRSASSSGRQPQSRSRERARGPVEDKQGPSRPAGQSLADFIDFDHYEAGNDRLVESLPSEASGYSSRSQKLHRLPRLSFSSLPSGGQAARGGDGDATLFGGFPRTDSDPASPRSSPNKTDRDDVDVRIVEDGGLPDVDDNDSVGIPRPDSPAMALPLVAPLPRKKQVRLSAVGYQPELESALWSSEA
ncbi:hypothetical protein VTK73DRAFT_4895 [Phialemonium thermophilum]|uniref:Uncharacterized protein n=1 Tax=Phialemonium thermophilum TaxID=223376 RepID=A0ABR3V6C5_9PEZI